MSQIRHVEIKRFRGIAFGEWAPRQGINALIGAGDSGKSTLLDAIDLALAVRRTGVFTDADFRDLDVADPVDIKVSIGNLPPALLDLETYAAFLRGWDAATAVLSDEPGPSLEPVLTVRVRINSDLEPRWGLYSDRAEAGELSRDLPFAERGRLAPTRLGAFANHHFSWGARSVLNRLTEERADASEALARAAREARAAFGDTAGEQVAETLRIVRTVARDAGVPSGQAANALLDAHGVSFSGGAVALHDQKGVPLRSLGVGSARLLVASLQAQAGAGSGPALIDELEHGLEPFRIIRLLHTLGSKDAIAPRQVFLTTHSPIAVRELAADQLTVIRKAEDGVLDIRSLGGGDGDQATVRACAEAFLAPHVIVCEGATEVGIVRGLDLWWCERGLDPMAYCGVSACDGGGASMFDRAQTFGRLGYPTALFRDSDVALTQAQSDGLAAFDVCQFAWSASRSTEQELFASLPDEALPLMVGIADDHIGPDAVNQYLKNADPTVSRTDIVLENWTPQVRDALGRAAGKGKWYKRVEPAERVGREVIGPYLEACQPALRDVVDQLRAWIDTRAAQPGPEETDTGGPADDDIGL